VRWCDGGAKTEMIVRSIALFLSRATFYRTRRHRLKIHFETFALYRLLVASGVVTGKEKEEEKS